MDQLTERLVEYALALSYEDLPPEVVERTKRLILDTVGCALGAAPWQAPPSPAPWPQTCSPAPRPR
jgi:2-methylcitrate dehydratase PrpD